MKFAGGGHVTIVEHIKRCRNVHGRRLFRSEKPPDLQGRWRECDHRQSPKHDKETEYSGYYRHCGYKADVAHDMDDPLLGFEYTTMSINRDKGKCLILSQQRIASAGMNALK